MARKRKNDMAQRSLLSLWEPPQDAGNPVGVLATTFTLDTALFEEECLARFVGVQSDPVRDGAIYRIEREEKLASLLCAAVIADVRHCGGRRSLRWDLLAARPRTGVMHSKISLLAWSDHVRVIVASANLTNEGYRRNQECVSSLDFNDAFADRSLLDPLLAYLRELLSITTGPARPRAEQLLEWVSERLPSHRSARGLQRHVILVGPNRPSYFKQLADLLPLPLPDQAHVVSPFFDAELCETGPEHALWQMMRQRGSAVVHMHVAGMETTGSNGWCLVVPKHVLNATPKTRSGALTQLHPVRVDDVLTEFGPERRPLHAKTLALSNDTWSALVVGSSNFTSAGTGLKERARNYEANVVYIMRVEPGHADRAMMDTRSLRGEMAIDSNKVDFDPAFDLDGSEGGGPPPLPAFFAEATLTRATAECYELALRFVDSSPAGTWIVLHEQAQVLDSAAWASKSCPLAVDLTLPCAGSPPSLLRVEWASGTKGADWPVNVITADSLPAPTELQGLSLAGLLDLLSSTLPLHEALRAWLRHQPDDDDADVESAAELVDPHAKVDTSGFLVKRVQRACWAMRHLRDRLESPVLSASAMAWRINGPVGANAVLAAMRQQCDPALSDEWAFLLCELFAEMNNVTLRGDETRVIDTETTQLMKNFLENIELQLTNALSDCSHQMQEYVEDALKGIPYAVA